MANDSEALWTRVAQLETDHAAALRRIAQLDGELVRWKHVAEMGAASARRLADKVREAEERSQRGGQPVAHGAKGYVEIESSPTE